MHLPDLPVPISVSVDPRDRAVWGSFIHSAIIKWYGSRDRPSTVGGHKGLQREMQLKLIFGICRYLRCISGGITLVRLIWIPTWDHDRPWDCFPNSAARKICPMPQNYAHNVLTLLWKQFTEWGSTSACRSSFDGLMDKSSCADDVNVNPHHSLAKSPWPCGKRPFLCLNHLLDCHVCCANHSDAW